MFKLIAMSLLAQLKDFMPAKEQEVPEAEASTYYVSVCSNGRSAYRIQCDNISCTIGACNKNRQASIAAATAKVYAV